MQPLGWSQTPNFVAGSAFAVFPSDRSSLRSLLFLQITGLHCCGCELAPTMYIKPGKGWMSACSVALSFWCTTSRSFLCGWLRRWLGVFGRLQMYGPRTLNDGCSHLSLRTG